MSDRDQVLMEVDTRDVCLSPTARQESDATVVTNAVLNSTVNGDTYAERAARTAASPENLMAARRRNVVENLRRDMQTTDDTPKRPLSASFTPSRYTSARTVFEALSNAEINTQEVKCLQRKMNGEVVITFNSAAAKENFVCKNSLLINNDNFAIQDIDRPLTFLTIYDAPFELSDLAIVRRLQQYCEVTHYRRGKFDFLPEVYNGLRHYRVRAVKPIPSFLRFGKYQILLKHEGQQPTCRRCNLTGHFSNACPNKICFNCENIGHEANMCPAPKLCSLCKSDEHLSASCTYSWITPIVRRTPTDETDNIEIDDASDISHETRCGDNFEWADNLSDDDEEEELNENAPLISAMVEPQASQEQLPPPDAFSTADDVNNPADVNIPADDVNNPADNVNDHAPITVNDPAPITVIVPDLTETPASPPSSHWPIAHPSTDLASSQPSASSDSPSQHVLDSDGFVRPTPPENPPCPPTSDPTLVPVSDTPDGSSTLTSTDVEMSAPPAKITRRTPAALPEALSFACLRKPTSPVLIAGKPKDSPPPTCTDPGKSSDDTPKSKRDKNRARKKYR